MLQLDGVLTRMKVMVCIKRVLDPYVKVRLNAKGDDIEDSKMAINPFDEIAIEEAVRLKEKGIVDEILVVSIGDNAVQESLRTALALGADRGLLIKTEQCFEPLNNAKILKQIALEQSPQLIILGKQSIDGDNNQTGQMLAGLLGWPQATFASKLEIEQDKATVTREVDSGMERVQVALPAVVTTDLRLNEPRYATLPNIMKAKRKPLEIKELSSLALTLNPHLQFKGYELPKARNQGVQVSSVKELLLKLQNDAKVL